MLFRTSRWWARELVRREQAWEQERARLVDQICHLAGRPWTLPPRPLPDRPPVVEESEYEAVT
jgi:hypothetical protein